MTANFNPPAQSLLDAIKSVVGDTGWKSGDDALRYFEDPRERFTGKGRLVVLPNSTAQVAAIVSLCNDAKAGIIPYGGGTGVVAGQLSIESDNAIILSLEKMNKVREVSVADEVMIVEAGCILENIHTAALAHNMMFPLSMASKGSCSIGGNLATNAGGIQVVRYGNARDLCLGIEAVLPCGTVLSELSPLRKNNTGYDLRHLLIGSEGTLGIITAATLVLKPIDPESVTVLCAVESPKLAMRLFSGIRQDLGDSIAGLELMSSFGLDLVTEHFPLLKAPFAEKYPWFLLVEVTGHKGIRDRVENALADCMEQDLLPDAVIAESESQRIALWSLRENIPDANRLTGAICSSDTSVPISKVDDFIEQSTSAVSEIYPGLRINSYGHIGDGNIHHNVFPPESVPKKKFVESNPGIIEAVRMAINEVTSQCGGSISAEHGIGRLKTTDLETYVSKAKRDAMKSIKSALDPNDILNPGALNS